ncbi:hypothetical protein HYDPIDRAFT_66499, partial [Hydnomerulius pinastri MD-312]
IYFPNDPQAGSSRPQTSNCQKKINQWRRWSSEIIPTLLPLFWAYLRESQSLRAATNVGSVTGRYVRTCVCETRHCSSDMWAETFVGMEFIKLQCCLCRPAPVQLMSMGLFACAPVTPSLAVDLHVLELVKTLFVWITPNTTAWSEALEEFLNRRGYYLKTK